MESTRNEYSTSPEDPEKLIASNLQKIYMDTMDIYGSFTSYAIECSHGKLGLSFSKHLIEYDLLNGVANGKRDSV